LAGLSSWTAKTALPAATATATGISEIRLATEAVAAKAKTRKSGPGGCQSCRSDRTAPPPARSAAIGTDHHERASKELTSTPRPTDAVSRDPRVVCIRTRDRCTRLRP
jgi:hypothetical protein